MLAKTKFFRMFGKGLTRKAKNTYEPILRTTNKKYNSKEKNSFLTLFLYHAQIHLVQVVEVLQSVEAAAQSPPEDQSAQVRMVLVPVHSPGPHEARGGAATSLDPCGDQEEEEGENCDVRHALVGEGAVLPKAQGVDRAQGDLQVQGAVVLGFRWEGEGCQQEVAGKKQELPEEAAEDSYCPHLHLPHNCFDQLHTAAVVVAVVEEVHCILPREAAVSHTHPTDEGTEEAVVVVVEGAEAVHTQHQWNLQRALMTVVAEIAAAAAKALKAGEGVGAEGAAATEVAQNPLLRTH